MSRGDPLKQVKEQLLRDHLAGDEKALLILCVNCTSERIRMNNLKPINFAGVHRPFSCSPLVLTVGSRMNFIPHQSGITALLLSSLSDLMFLAIDVITGQLMRIRP
jgi:hypothetical protein